MSPCLGWVSNDGVGGSSGSRFPRKLPGGRETFAAWRTCTDSLVKQIVRKSRLSSPVDRGETVTDHSTRSTRDITQKIALSFALFSKPTPWFGFL
jgi:hypothetical protein